MSAEFTKKELFEIEKQFDIYAGQTLHGVADLVSKLGPDHEVSKKILSEVAKDYDLYRSISAKASLLRGDTE